MQHVRVSTEIFVETFRAKLTVLWELTNLPFASGQSDGLIASRIVMGH